MEWTGRERSVMECDGKVWKVWEWCRNDVGVSGMDLEKFYVTPCITSTAQSQTVTGKNTEREGLPTIKNMRQALQAQIAPSGNMANTIHVFLLLKSKKFVVIILTVNSIHIKCAVYPTAYVTFSELITRLMQLEIALVLWHSH